MEYRHEIIDFGESIPVKFFVHQLGYSGLHWHNSLELLFVVSGSVSITVAGHIHTLTAGDVILINANDPHELNADECIMAAVQIKLTLFDERVVRRSDLYFDCNSVTDPGNPGLLKLKRIVAQFVKIYADNDEGRALRAKSLSYSLMAELMTCFRVERARDEQKHNQHQYERITRIVSYINEHCHEEISLQQLAEQEYLSAPFLSRFFVRMMGMNFTAYLNQQRLSRAMSDLLESDLTIEEVASQNGFANAQAFVQQFRKKYNMLPSQYRREHKGMPRLSASRPVDFNEYTILETHQFLHSFAAFLHEEPQAAEQPAALPEIATYGVADAAAAGISLQHTWKTFTGVGSAKELLLADVQEMLRQLQADVGFRYVKFHGILSDDMRMCLPDREGRLQYSFVYVDKVLDFLQSIGLKPLIQLSFMPAALAKHPQRRIMQSTMINSEPAELSAWCDLTRAFVEHLLQRYGAREVESWLFTVWNEPDTPLSLFGFASDEEFYQFYRATWQTLHAVHPGLRIAGPSTYFDPIDNGTWLKRFTEWCIRHDCLPDDVLFHYYGTNLAPSQWGKEKNLDFPMSRLQLTRDEHLLNKCISLVRNYTTEHYGDTSRVFLTEWNFSPAHRSLLGDTCFRSCYLVKNILENMDRLDGMGYWMLTDLFEEHQVPESLFHGGMGLFTYNGIRKASYYAYWLLGKLGDMLVGQGDGWFLTRQGGEYQLMLYHYRHYSDLYASGEMFDMTETDRYTAFGPYRKRAFSIAITGVEEGLWQAQTYILNREHGSSFDKWVEMGAQPVQSPEECDLLRSLSRPMMRRSILSAQHGELRLEAELEPLEVQLVRIWKDCQI
ncbi:MAG: helix-turn-helix domain-containing protein [Clostridiales bacterium]|nr:helix-turn-helix domain-containing protein [Clostridiales bacterium]